MNRLFSKIRLGFMEKNKIGNYIKYAIGEIFLVAIGILFALQINNWNESRKEKIYQNKVYAQIRQDLQLDTLYVNNVIEGYKEKHKRLEEIINRKIPKSYYDTINEINYKNCEKCVSEITQTIDFQITVKGYQLFQTINVSQNIETDTLSLLIEDFYTNSIPIINEFSRKLSEIRDETIKDFQKYDWFVDIACYQKRYNKDFLKYIFESDDYRNRSARFLIYSKYNYLRFLESYKKHATELLEILDKKTGKQSDLK